MCNLIMPFSSSGLLASGASDCLVKLWNTTSGTLIRNLTGHLDSVNAVTFSSNGLLASGSNDSTIKLWNTDAGSVIFSLATHSVLALAFDSNDILASGGTDMVIKLWDISSGTLIRDLVGSSDVVWSLAFDGNNRLASACDSLDKNIRFWTRC